MRYLTIVALLGFYAAIAFAQQTQPSGLDTPKGTLRQLNIALRDGDASTVKQLIQTKNDGELKLVAAMADYAAALASLHKEAVKAFGTSGANLITGDAQVDSAEGLEAIDKAEAKVDGDAATVNYPPGENKEIKSVHLVKIEGRWMLPLSQLIEGANADAEQKRLEELTHQTALATQTTGEVTQGRYKTAQDAAHAWQGRLLDVVLASAPLKKGE